MTSRSVDGREVAVVGHAGRDLVLVVDEVPGESGSTKVGQRLERPGGKGYNQAVVLAQLGHRPALLGVVGDDAAGRWVQECASKDGIDPAAVSVRAGVATSLVVSVVTHGSWRYLEHLPADTFAGPEDVRAHRGMFERAAVTSLQLQERTDTCLEAARIARSHGRLVVADGVPGDKDALDELLSLVDVVRADEQEAGLLVGTEVTDGRDAARAAQEVQARGPRLVVFAAGGDGNAAAWPGGSAVVPFGDQEVVDTTGGGDALMAGLISGLLAGADPLSAVCTGVAAAGPVVATVGGRPDFDPEEVRLGADRLRRRVERNPPSR